MSSTRSIAALALLSLLPSVALAQGVTEAPDRPGNEGSGPFRRLSS
jgi:hypothetical protein